jgi:hypothetical protein
MQRKAIEYIPSSHLDLFWLGSFRTCLERGAEVIKGYLDRCLEAEEETFLLETVVFAEYFLERHPEYLAPVRELVAAGRLEVGAAFIDRWETLVLAESHVRNIVIGQRWCREVLGADARTAAHPDLPSLVPQIAQIYRQAGVRYYATSRKVFEHGQVWRHRAPDGTTLLVLNYPRIYLFTILDPADVPAELLPRLHATSLDLERTQAGFPRGVVAVPGSAGDLADRRNFRRSHGRYLEEFVGQYREQYPEFDFGYTIPSRLLSEYEAEPGLPELAGEVPSVWGVAADEEAAFFRRDRRLEATLLTAETLAAAACHLGVDWRPAGTEAWQGMFHDAAFFGRKDLVTPGEELAELWRMHVFTQDHNVLWWGKRNQQVRMGLPTVAVKGAIVYGSPFFAVAWDETVAGAAPRRPDEIAPEDYDRYREVQGWLHLRGAGGGMTICSDNPGVHHDGSLEAVLLRTPPSCGDPRLYWENAGEQVFDFCFIPGDGDWREADAPRLATARFRPPVARAVPSGGGTLPTSDSLLAIEGAQVSAIYPGADSASTMVRFYETAGRSGEARLTGPLCDGPAALVDLLEDTLPEQEALTGKPGDWRVDLPAWRIVTVRLDAVTSDV